MREPVHFIPIVTTVIAIVFAWRVFTRYRQRRSGPHLLWWGAGILIYGLGTLTEAVVTIFGWHEWVFRTWYIAGALLGGAPLAQGTVYLLSQRRTANRLTMAVAPFIAVAAICVLLSPINLELVEPFRLTGRVIEWQWVRAFSPFINSYAFVFLVGGAALSAWRYARDEASHHRFLGNTFIAVGALLPGIGGMATRFGYTEVLYVTEFVGLILIWVGYRWNIKTPAAKPGHATMRSASGVQLST